MIDNHSIQQFKKVIISSSKSLCHRYLIGSFVSGKNIEINNFNFCDDTLTTLYALEALGASFNKTATSVKYKGFTKKNGNISINCHQSASTFRMILPLAIYLYNDVTFYGDESLFSRPLDSYEKLLKSQGITFTKTDNSLHITSNIKCEQLFADESKSSQFTSGLLFLVSFAQSHTKIIKENSKPCKYIEMTLHVLKECGINILNKISFYAFESFNNNHINNITVPSDMSLASNFIVYGCFAKNIEINNIDFAHIQPEDNLVDLLNSIGGNINILGNTLLCEKSSLSPFTFDLENAIDLGPVLIALASLINGTSTLINYERLKIKESNRLDAMISQLAPLGVKFTFDKNKLFITGTDIKFKRVDIKSYNDHRIVMALCILAFITKGTCTIDNSFCVNKSFPDFINQLIEVTNEDR